MSYITLDELKAQAQIDDTLDDGVLQVALDAAVRAVDDWCNRSFETVDTADMNVKTSRLYTARTPHRLIVDDLAKVDTVEEKLHRRSDFETVDPDQYDVEPANAEADGEVITEIWREPHRSWPKGRQLVKVTGWFGWPSVPDSVVQATLLQASRFAQRRNAQFGVAPVVGMDGTSGMRLLAKLDADVELLLNGVRRDPTRQPS